MEVGSWSRDKPRYRAEVGMKFPEAETYTPLNALSKRSVHELTAATIAHLPL